MGQIIFHCTSCGAKLSAELNEVGAEFECPKCQKMQIVPGGQAQATSAQTSPGTPAIPSGSKPGLPVIHIPKRKIIMSTAPVEEEEEDDEYYEEEEVGGTGLALFAVALGTAGLLLCGFSMVWMFLKSSSHDGGVSWWLTLLVFLATFLMGLMGLVLAQLARLVVRLADRVSRLDVEEDD